MPYVITELCSRDGACAEVCPVECIVAGPEGDAEWGMAYFIDPDSLHRLRCMRTRVPGKRDLS